MSISRGKQGCSLFCMETLLIILYIASPVRVFYDNFTCRLDKISYSKVIIDLTDYSL